MLRIYFFIALITVLLPINSISSAKANSQAPTWQLLCNKDKSDCKAYAQILFDNNTIASTLIFKNIQLEDQSISTVAIIMLPLGFHIPSGIKITIDDKMTVSANLLECKIKGCRAVFPLDKNIIDALKVGHEVSIYLVDSNSRKSLELSYSLDGFSKTYKAMQISSK